MANRSNLSDDFVTRDMLSKIRSLNENVVETKSSLLTEDSDKEDKDAIAITDDAKFGSLALQNQINQFRASVDSGAQFSKPEDGKVAESPLIYMPSNGNLIFSGVIPSLNNLKFQYVLKTTTGNGCFMWSDGLILNKENIQLLNKLYGFYLNWKEQWESEVQDLESLSNDND